MRQLPNQLLVQSVSTVESDPDAILLASSVAAPIRLLAVSLMVLSKNFVSLIQASLSQAEAEPSRRGSCGPDGSRRGSNQLLLRSKKH